MHCARGERARTQGACGAEFQFTNQVGTRYIADVVNL